jgi:FkbM family methyltransferase
MSETPSPFIKTALAVPLRLALRWRRLRARLFFELWRDYYDELGVSIPLPRGLRCPITSPEHWASYENIFAEREYDPLLAVIPLPERWVDMGCHAGHFSLRLLALHAEAGTRDRATALLVDADPRVAPAIAALREANGMSAERFQFLHAALGGEGGEVIFGQGRQMTSEAVRSGVDYEKLHRVPRLDPAAMRAAFAPPYDLVKLDVEGAEFFFLRDFAPVLVETRYLLFEWHSWQPGGGGREELLRMVAEKGFDMIGELHGEREVPHRGGVGRAGVVLLKNRRNA